MSKREVKSMYDCLYSRGKDIKLVNVKFFRGSNKLIRASELRAELFAIAEQKRNGEVQPSLEAPRTDVKKVDVRAWVAEM